MCPGSDKSSSQLTVTRITTIIQTLTVWRNFLSSMGKYKWGASSPKLLNWMGWPLKFYDYLIFEITGVVLAQME